MFKLCAFSGGLAFLLSACVSSANHDSSERTRNGWSLLAAQDLDAAKSLIEDNHPGAVPAHGDLNFQHSLRNGYAVAKSQLNSIDNYSAYRGLLWQFAAALGDGHIGTGSIFSVDYDWPGFFVHLDEDNKWIVLDHELAQGPPVASALVSCDGIDVNDIVEKQLNPYVPLWNVKASQKLSSYRLLLDRKESEFTQFERCDFRLADGSIFTHVMKWTTASPDALSASLASARPRANRALALNNFDGKWWIRLGNLGSKAPDLVREIEAVGDEIAAAPLVVIDVRGNSGGNSQYAKDIAKILYGAAAVDAVSDNFQSNLPAHPKDAISVWRASPDNLETLHLYLQFFGTGRNANESIASQMQILIDRMTLALEQGEDFVYYFKSDEKSTALNNETDADVSQKSSVRLRNASNTILITDNVCFSSCLLAVDMFRSLGVFHVGQETNANTHYSEVRLEKLPSGLSTFTTLQAIHPDQPYQIGPYAPQHDLDDSTLFNDERLRAEIFSDQFIKGNNADQTEQ